MASFMSPLTNNVRLIGRFVPDELSREGIQAGLRSLLPACCRRMPINVRNPGASPAYEAGQLNPQSWHVDFEGPRGNVKHMTVWATEDPTEVRDRGGTVFRFNPFDLIWFDNFEMEHRQPTTVRHGHRWFACVQCTGENE
jgi:hypothetical protein